MTKLTIKELYDQCKVQSTLKVMDAKTGYILCRNFNPNKHLTIGELTVSALWADISVSSQEFSKFVTLVLCVYAYKSCVGKDNSND